MHLQLTDLLTCPECGPDAGLIVRTDVLEDRRVLEGALGCARCLGRWPVQRGLALLDPAESSGSETAPADRDQAVRIAALLGVTEGPAVLLVAGPATAHATALAPLIEGIEVIAAQDTGAHRDEAPGVSRLAAVRAIPLVRGRIRGVWLSGETANRWLEEGARILAPGGRLVLEPAPPDARDRLAAAGLEPMAEQDATILSVRSR